MLEYFIQTDTIIAGMTKKDRHAFENNNMALHSCESVSNIIKNRENLAVELGVTLEDFVCPTQTHSTNFYEVTAADKGRGARSLDNAINETDAIYTFETDIVLCSFSADCVPITFYHDNGVIGVIHSGWRGTVKEITKKLFTHLIEEKLCEPSGFHVHIGAALCQKNFEVDEDVARQFKQLGYADAFIQYDASNNKYFIDNQQTVKKQCSLVGIPAKQIKINDMCTMDSEAGFSHRRDQGLGRHLTFIRRLQ
ncbi:MAG TPA: polyphenol oxidase family protein [Pseudogracilibacillus sp.]|nr:polyphenol oxidase family protein [Pseudogracilibacillus sp.]